MKKIIGLALSLILSTSLSYANIPAASETDEASWLDTLLDKLGADGGYDNSKSIDFSILPGPFYNPEMSLGLGISAIGLYQVDPQDTLSPISSLMLNGFASVNGSVGLVVDNRTFFKQDQWRFYLNAQLSDAPEVYYGTGYQQNHQDKNLVHFHQQYYALQPSLLKRVGEHSLVGAGLDMSYANTSEISPASSSEVDASVLEASSRSVGLNLRFDYDSRDNTHSPYSGQLVQIDTGLFRPFYGSNTHFQTLNFNYSQYQPLGPRNSVLAWQFKSRFSDGDVPWNMLSTIGGGSDLRGYTNGRYRDKHSLLSQVEYRWDLPKRHGMVFWLAAAAIAPELKEFKAEQILPSAGVGYRLEVKTRVNLRLDLGVGKDETGFYFNVDEAF
ncbi:BamA/TamA family outer membrane protein [Agarivorans sp.]|uniref:BamA/TamA family outer membrane protein n=1 Tax=Agarivorans sp. TaxID=1872412 RepID=UPI003D031EED